MDVIVKSKKTEDERRSEEHAAQVRKHYYKREIRDGARFRSKAGTKEQIRRALR